jgi:hypothetical protein
MSDSVYEVIEVVGTPSNGRPQRQLPSSAPPYSGRRLIYIGSNEFFNLRKCSTAHR